VRTSSAACSQQGEDTTIIYTIYCKREVTLYNSIIILLNQYENYTFIFGKYMYFPEEDR